MFSLNPNGFDTPYYLLHLLARLCTYIFYRRIHKVNMENFPLEGPVIICGTHNNQFVDGILLLATCPRMVHFIIADSAFQKPYLAYFLTMLPLIRTKRPQVDKVSNLGQHQEGHRVHHVDIQGHPDRRGGKFHHPGQSQRLHPHKKY